MDIQDIKNKITIKGKEYEVLYKVREADPAPDKQDRIRLFTGVYLHNGSDSLSPTHLLMVYDNNEIKFIQLKGEKLEESEINF